MGGNDRLELLGDLTWTEWSKIKRLPLVRTSGPANGATLDTLTFNFDDTWRLAVGGNYKWSGPWTLRAGVAFDQSPVPNAQDRSVRLPDNDRYWLTFGALLFGLVGIVRPALSSALERSAVASAGS